MRFILFKTDKPEFEIKLSRHAAIRGSLLSIVLLLKIGGIFNAGAKRK